MLIFARILRSRAYLSQAILPAVLDHSRTNRFRARLPLRLRLLAVLALAGLGVFDREDCIGDALLILMGWTLLCLSLILDRGCSFVSCVSGSLQDL